MRLILTAILALGSAEPLSTALLDSSFGRTLLNLTHSPDVLAVFGVPNLMLQVLFVLCCYEVVGLLEVGLMRFGSSLASALKPRESFTGTAALYSSSGVHRNGLIAADAKKPE